VRTLDDVVVVAVDAVTDGVVDEADRIATIIKTAVPKILREVIMVDVCIYLMDLSLSVPTRLRKYEKG
jgi:hypothetical protein